MPIKTDRQFRTMAEAALPHDAYWCIDEVHGLTLWQMLSTTDFAAHAAGALASASSLEQEYFKAFGAPESAVKSEQSDEKPSKPYMMDGSVAVIGMSGALTKRPTSYSNSGSTAYIRRMVDLAASDKDVTAIVLRVDTPGGSVSGTGDCADTVRAAAAKKRVLVSIEDLCASAGYWIVSGATQIYCNPSGAVGSIGTYMAIMDASHAYQKDGYEVKVYKAGAMKGAGIPGTKITEAQDDYFQKTVDGYNAHFLAGVAAGRKMSVDRVAQLNDGRCHMAADALALGLIDGIATFSEVLEMAKAPDADPTTEDETPDLDDAGMKQIGPSADPNDAGDPHTRSTERMSLLERTRAFLGLTPTAASETPLTQEAKEAATAVSEAAEKDMSDLQTAHAAETAKLKAQLDQALKLKAEAEAAAAAAVEQEHIDAVDALISDKKLTPAMRAEAIVLRKAGASAFDAVFDSLEPMRSLAGEAGSGASQGKTVEGGRAQKAAERSTARGRNDGTKLDTTLSTLPIANGDLAAEATLYARENKVSYGEALRIVATRDKDLVEF